MRYHAHLEYGNKGHLWQNFSEAQMTEDLVLPFINGQVILLNTGASPNKSTKLFNMKNATFLKVFRTEASLAATDDKSVAE